MLEEFNMGRFQEITLCLSLAYFVFVMQVTGMKGNHTRVRKGKKLNNLCRAEPFYQTYKIDGCKAARIANKRCIGRCHCDSFFQPKVDDNAISINACTICTPKIFKQTIGFRCGLMLINQTIEFVRSCECKPIWCSRREYT